ncbi:MAG: hypothetical protein IKL21_06345 [Clostridia bacterium]|nr:hypothetical protein [Clostridia bacterium]
MKKRKSDPISLAAAVFMLVVGVLLGSVFTFGMQYWNDDIPREDCTMIKTQLLSYDEIRQGRHPMGIKEIAIDCSDGNRYFIDGVSINEDLINKLSSLTASNNITLLIHPNSNTIVEFSSGETVLLDFNDTIKRLEGEADGFLLLGVFTYFCALIGVYYIVYHIKHRKNK